MSVLAATSPNSLQLVKVSSAVIWLHHQGESEAGKRWKLIPISVVALRYGFQDSSSEFEFEVCRCSLVQDR